MIVTAYRITKAAHAAAMWSGIGARDFGGRWNSKGTAVVYTSENRSLAAMEQLVHLITPRVLKGYVLASISFDDSRMRRIAVASLPDPVAPPALRKYGDDWASAAAYPVLAVPSVIIPGEWNYLVNPAHPEFPALAKSPATPFVSDNRLG